MRILFLAHRLPYPPNKGDKIRSFHELKAMAASHEVDLFCFYDQPEDRQYIPAVRDYCRELYAEKISWARSRAQALLAAVSGHPFTTAFFHSPVMALRIREAVRDRKYDLIFVFSSSMAPYVEGFSKIPRVLDMVDVDSDKWTQYASYARPPMSWLWRSEGRRLAGCERRWTRDFSLTLLCTDAEAAIFAETAPAAKTEVLDNRTDTGYFDPDQVRITPEIAGYQPYIVFTGSMDYFPNVDAVTWFHREVFPKVRARVPDAKFVIAGRNPVAAVRRLAEDPAVRVTRAVADIRPYLRGASVAVAPLRVARGVQTKIIEAMAMGLPVAASSKAAMALPEVLRQAVHAEVDPVRLSEYLVEKLQVPTAPTETRSAVLNFASDSKWQERLEMLLRRAVESQRVEAMNSANADVRPSPLSTVHADIGWRNSAYSSAEAVQATGLDRIGATPPREREGG